MITIAIDPGLRGVGIAAFEGKELMRAGYVKNSEQKLRGPQAWYSMAHEVRYWVWPSFGLIPCDTLVLEGQQIYLGAKINPAHLIEIAGVAGAVAYAIDAKKRVSYLPRIWKGQVPKDVHNQRTLAKLSEKEQAVIEYPATSLRHNVYDAIGLGMYHLRR